MYSYTHFLFFIFYFIFEHVGIFGENPSYSSIASTYTSARIRVTQIHLRTLYSEGAAVVSVIGDDCADRKQRCFALNKAKERRSIYHTCDWAIEARILWQLTKIRLKRTKATNFSR